MSNVHEDDWFKLRRKNSINQRNDITSLQQNFEQLKREAVRKNYNLVKVCFHKRPQHGLKRYVIMKRCYAHINDLTEEKGLGFGRFPTIRTPTCPTCSQASQTTGQLTDRLFIFLQKTQPQGSLLKDESADSDKNMTKTNIRNWEIILCCSYLGFLSQQKIHHKIHFVVVYLLTRQHVFC